MIYTDATIRRKLNSKELVIAPYNPKNLGTNSYDLTLSPHLKVYKKPKLWHRFLAFLGLKQLYLNPKGYNEVEKVYIPETGLILEKGQLYLASTDEYTVTNNAVPKLEGKSSLARLGLSIHETAGFGDVGFAGNWTLEICPKENVIVFPYMKICQISYLAITEPPLVAYGDKPDAKYQGQTEAQESLYHKNYDKHEDSI